MRSKLSLLPKTILFLSIAIRKWIIIYLINSFFYSECKSIVVWGSHRRIRTTRLLWEYWRRRRWWFPVDFLLLREHINVPVLLPIHFKYHLQDVWRLRWLQRIQRLMRSWVVLWTSIFNISYRLNARGMNTNIRKSIFFQEIKL